jgi:uncharacterized iron-regulated protein
VRALVVLACSAVLAAGCASTVEKEVTTGAAPQRRPLRDIDPNIKPDPVRFDGDAPYAWIDGNTGKSITYDEVVARARASQVIVVGEQHDQASHHEVQRRIVTTLAAPSAKIVVGLEMLTWEKQATLDRFNTGELDADAFAAAVDWQKAWGFTFDLYRPILVDGREAGATFKALNAPRELVRAVRKKGIDGLSPDEVRALPDLDLGDLEHRAWFKGIFAGGGHPMKDADVDAFYTAQVVWDESMADRAAQALTDGATHVVVLAGAGHVARGRGIPQRVERRVTSAKVMSIVPLTDVDSENVLDQVKAAVLRGEGDVLVIPRFEEELSL